MRPELTPYELVTARTLDEALEMTGAGWRPFAGGTDLMVELQAGRLQAGRYVSLLGVKELAGIEVSAEAVVLGATTTYTAIRAHAVLRSEFPALVAAASQTGAVAIQNRGTLGGNIGHGSPAADAAPPLLIHDAVIELAGKGGRRRVPYCEYHVDYKRSVLAAGEIILGVHLPRRGAGWRYGYHKAGGRRAQAITKVSFAGAARVEGGRIAEIRLAFGSVAPFPLRARAMEASLEGARLDALPELDGSEIRPIDDLRSTAQYRRRVALGLVREFLETLG